MFTLQFQTGGSAFRGGNEPLEVERILTVVASRVHAGHTDGNCVDSNGNTVGQWTLLPDLDDVEQALVDAERAGVHPRRVREMRDSEAGLDEIQAETREARIARVLDENSDQPGFDRASAIAAIAAEDIDG